MDDRLDRYAELAVRVGANVAPGQLVDVSGYLAHAPLIRAITRAAYKAGARYVDVRYIDQHVRRSMIELRPRRRFAGLPHGSSRSSASWPRSMAPRSASSATRSPR